MGSSSPRNPLESWAENPRDVRVGELLNEFLDLRASGRAINPDEFLKRHPDFAADLSRHFEGLGLIDDMRALSGGNDGQASRSPDETLAIGEARASGTSPSSIPVIEGYQVMRELGRGGMGIVYKALQESTQRVCAIKLLIDGTVASPATRKRFEREIALSAALKHPNIVPIYESGHADGRMYYAMEYVHGQALTAFARERNLSIRQRLSLFVEVCKGVAHAHQRGVIHRDIKPSNILVDAEGVPHIYDFGLAKAGNARDLQLSVTEQLVGTPAYMSPEQIGGDPGAVDIRTDVYSLGIILFELLTAQLPYVVSSNIAQTFQNITQADPARPSKVNKQIDDEVEAITLKALAKTKEERYQSVTELAADIERYLRGDPITARKVTLYYLTRKAISRHRTQLITLLLGIAAITTGLLLTRTVHDKTVVTTQLAANQETRSAEGEGSAAALDALGRAIQKEAPDVQQRILATLVQTAGGVAGNMSSKQPLPAAFANKMAELVTSLARQASTEPASVPTASRPVRKEP